MDFVVPIISVKQLPAFLVVDDAAFSLVVEVGKFRRRRKRPKMGDPNILGISVDYGSVYQYGYISCGCSKNHPNTPR
jgi:hypothetical protein